MHFKFCWWALVISCFLLPELTKDGYARRIYRLKKNPPIGGLCFPASFREAGKVKRNPDNPVDPV
jgi:hypothetical protein